MSYPGRRSGSSVGSDRSVTVIVTDPFWFAAGVTISDGPGQEKTGVAVRATFDVPFVFRLTRHVFFQVGPQISYLNQLSGQPDLKGFSGGASAGLSLRL